MFLIVFLWCMQFISDLHISCLKFIRINYCRFGSSITPKRCGLSYLVGENHSKWERRLPNVQHYFQRPLVGSLSDPCIRLRGTSHLARKGARGRGGGRYGRRRERQRVSCFPPPPPPFLATSNTFRPHFTLWSAPFRVFGFSLDRSESHFRAFPFFGPKFSPNSLIPWKEPNCFRISAIALSWPLRSWHCESTKH